MNDLSDVERLRDLAAKAYRGPWTAYQDRVSVSSHAEIVKAYGVLQDRTADYIAAISPDVLTGLLDRLEAAERDRDELRMAVYRAWVSRNIREGSENRWDDILAAAGVCRTCHHDHGGATICYASVGGPSPEPCYCDSDPRLSQPHSAEGETK